ncbi:MAG: hypothetical protein Q9227_002020 [Pyrenula ochraceoflavens]
MKDFTDNLQPAESGREIIAKERAQSDLNVQQLSEHLLTPEFLSRQSRIVQILQADPIFSKKTQLNLARPHRFHLGLARAKALRRLAVKHGWNRDDYKMADYLVDEMSPYHLTWTMFSTSIHEQGDDTQRAYWGPKDESWSIIGAYAQTEMGHGSNVRGLELEARWDHITKEFVLHSPTITASKFWNGALGRTANHAIVVAQLMLPEEEGIRSYGPHQFIVQIRDMKTCQPLEGVIIGDIGPKYGYASMDNGYMLFNNFHVPHSAMLARYARVDPTTGKYTKPANPAVVYGSLTYVRAQIIMHARLILARAVTIATRYTTIRRQFQDRDAQGGSPEVTVLDYPTVQIRVLPLLATTFALHYTGLAMQELYTSTRSSIENQGDFTGLAEMHAASSGLKSICTMLAADGIETSRRAMGGHGFHGASGMIPLNSDYLSKPTVEGDNWMITQQTASYLLKQMTDAVKSSPENANAPLQQQYRRYLRNMRQQVVFDVLRDDAELVEAFRHRASAMAHNVFQKRTLEKRSWTSLMIELHKLSRAHSQALLVSNFYNGLETTASLDPSSPPVLRLLFRLFALYTIEVDAADFLMIGAITNDQLSTLSMRIQEVMNQIRPHAVRLVDAWAVPDFLLDSALGNYDGDVYNELFRRVHRENPLNEETFNPDWKTEEILLGEGEEVARRRIAEMVKVDVKNEQWEKAKL